MSEVVRASLALSGRSPRPAGQHHQQTWLTPTPLLPHHLITAKIAQSLDEQHAQCRVFPMELGGQNA